MEVEAVLLVSNQRQHSSNCVKTHTLSVSSENEKKNKKKFVEFSVRSVDDDRLFFN